MSGEWVQCDRCQKWRKLPLGVSPDLLPEVWYCENNSWDPVYSSCQVGEETEEQTTTPATAAPLPPPPPASSSKPIPLQRPPPKRPLPPPSSVAPMVVAPLPSSPEPVPTLPAFVPNPNLGVRDALQQLVGTLQDTRQLLVDLNSNSDAQAIYHKLNSIPHALTQTIKSVEKETSTSMQCLIPLLLLSTVERVLDNNVSLFTKGELERIKALDERVHLSAKRYKKLHDELDY
ncbi:hypothetical protein BASA81_002558 [Batrachochytrium salamandrivorans]|nr:hypothetical protein BASA81_002558 [Batrachochytrium salamandrivorans]